MLSAELQNENARHAAMGRLGVSRIEILLAFLILAVICGLVLLAIMRVREAADRSKCANNLKQIALACHNYNDSNQGHLPPLTDQGDNAATEIGVPGFFFNILPYVQSDYLYTVYKWKGRDGYNASSSKLVFSGTIKRSLVQQWGGSANQFYRVYVDPADKTANQMRDVPMQLPDGSTGYYATGSYAANGLVFGSNVARLPETFADGCAYTIMFAERPQVCRTASGEAVYNLWGLGFYSPHMPAFATLTPDDPPGLISTGQAAPVVPLPDQRLSDRDVQIRARIGRQKAEPQPPDFATPAQMLRGARSCDPRLPGSPHFNVLQAAMADGSVHVFARTVSPWVFWAACTPNGDEDLRADW